MSYAIQTQVRMEGEACSLIPLHPREAQLKVRILNETNVLIEGYLNEE